MKAQLDALRDLALRHAHDGLLTRTTIPGVVIAMGHAPTELRPGLFEPMLCLVLQGAKEVLIGERRLRYDPACYFVATVELAAAGRVIEASRERPYVSVAMTLDRDLLTGLLGEIDAAARDEAAAAAFGVSPVTPPLVDGFTRLIALLDTPADIPVLAPMLQREILYRLLQGPHAQVLRQVARADSRLSQVRRTIAWLRENFDKPLRIEALADLAGMSVASFHRHFRAATAMSPLQFQKSLRLQQARLLLIAQPDAARAGYAVGYESASQFSREYARLFGVPPLRDAQRLRGDAAALAELGA